MRITDFTDDIIQAIYCGDRVLTADERSFLIQDTPHFEECPWMRDALERMDDKELMRTACATWAEHAKDREGGACDSASCGAGE